MKRVLILTLVLLTGLVLSQVVPLTIGALPPEFIFARQAITMALLSFIMIEVGREFTLDQGSKASYAVDYGVAATAAAFPWLLVTGYFLLFLMPAETASGNPAWVEALLAGRFAAPTSAGVLFSMLAAAGLAGTWAYRKTRILAIFDDLDTVLLMIPLKMLLVGFVWQLGGVMIATVLTLALGWKYFRALRWKTTWPWVMAYSVIIAVSTELIYLFTKSADTGVGVHVEVLLPAFVLGCALRPHGSATEDHEQEGAGFLISLAFMFLVGFSMPAMFGSQSSLSTEMGLGELALHVLAVTVISNIGKMFACLCYRREASFRERLAVAVSLFPRGEVGAGVLAVSLAYGLSGPFVTVAFLSLALNLIMTGLFIMVVRSLLAEVRGQGFVRGRGKHAV